MPDFDANLIPGHTYSLPFTQLAFDPRVPQLFEAHLIQLPSTGVTIDDTDPVVTIVSPTPGEIAGTVQEARNTPIVVEVTDSAPGLGRVHITLKYTHNIYTLAVWDGDGFLAPFNTADSFTTAITGGIRFTILPTGGWAGDIEVLKVSASDLHGNAIN